MRRRSRAGPLSEATVARRRQREHGRAARAFGCASPLHGSADAHLALMALVRVEVLEGRAAEEKRALLRTLHAALPEALGVPDADLTLRLLEHSSERFAAPMGHSELFTVVAVSAVSMRSGATRDHVREAIKRAVESCGVPRDDVLVVLGQPAGGDWRASSSSGDE